MAEVTITCPNCESRGVVDDSFVGRRIKCHKCGHSFIITIDTTPDIDESNRIDDSSQPLNTEDNIEDNESDNLQNNFNESPSFNTTNTTDFTNTEPINKSDYNYNLIKPAINIKTKSVNDSTSNYRKEMPADFPAWVWKTVTVVLGIIAFFYILVPSYDYKVVETTQSSPTFTPGQIIVDEDSIDSLGAKGWELVGVVNDIETSFPNFGKDEYHTGIKTNTHSKGVSLIFKKRKLW